MRHTKNILATTISTILIGSGFYTYNVIDNLHIQLNEKERLIAEANEDIDRLVFSQNDLINKLNHIKNETKILNQTIDNKNESIRSLQQQLEKTKKDNENYPRREVSRGNLKVIKTMNMELTFYTNHPSENGGTYGGKVLTKTGYDITNAITYQGYGIAASFNSELPLYSLIEIEGLGKFVILDSGSGVGKGRLDVLVGSKQEAYKRGRYTAKVNVLRVGK